MSRPFIYKTELSFWSFSHASYSDLTDYDDEVIFQTDDPWVGQLATYVSRTVGGGPRGCPNAEVSRNAKVTRKKQARFRMSTSRSSDRSIGDRILPFPSHDPDT